MVSGASGLHFGAPRTSFTSFSYFSRASLLSSVVSLLTALVSLRVSLRSLQRQCRCSSNVFQSHPHILFCSGCWRMGSLRLNKATEKKRHKRMERTMQEGNGQRQNEAESTHHRHAPLHSGAAVFAKRLGSAAPLSRTCSAVTACQTKGSRSERELCIVTRRVTITGTRTSRTSPHRENELP